jgi:hypothetical protein
MYVRMLAATQMHPSDPCDAYVQSEAWVNPGGTPDFKTNGPGSAQWAIGNGSPPFYGYRTGNSKHWYVNWVQSQQSWQWILIDELSRMINLGAPQSAIDQCNAAGYVWNNDNYTCGPPNTPIVVDRDGSGFRLTSASKGVAFDIDADGVQDNVAWTPAGDSNAFLVMDRNGNGTIDNGGELFGTATLLSTGARASNGFMALAELDSNADGVISRSDTSYAQLRLWTDANHNGISEPRELETLFDARLTTIYLGYQPVGQVDEQGNQFWLKGSVLISKRGVERTRAMFDVILARQ